MSPENDIYMNIYRSCLYLSLSRFIINKKNERFIEMIINEPFTLVLSMDNKQTIQNHGEPWKWNWGQVTVLAESETEVKLAESETEVKWLCSNRARRFSSCHNRFELLLLVRVSFVFTVTVSIYSLFIFLVCVFVLHHRDYNIICVSFT